MLLFAPVSAIADDAATATPREADWSEPEITGFAERQRTLDAHEARLALWEQDLTRRATDDAYFQDLEGYVTPSALARAFVLGSLVSVVATLLVLNLLERRGLWRTVRPSRSTNELNELEARVLTGLREFDGLLSRVYERLQAEATGASARGARRAGRDGVSNDPVADQAMPATPSGRPPSASSIRQQVASLARGGVARDEIGRRLGIGHAEVDFILRAEASR